MSSQPPSFVRLMIDEDSSASIKKYFGRKESKRVMTTDWNGSIDSLIPFINNIEFSESSVSVQLDIYDIDLLPKYPTEERIEEEIKKNIERNREIKEQHQKDIGKVGAAI